MQRLRGVQRLREVQRRVASRDGWPAGQEGGCGRRVSGRAVWNGAHVAGLGLVLSRHALVSRRSLELEL